MKPILAALLAAMSCAGVAQAQSPPLATADVLTLQEALTQAGAISPANEAAEYGIRAAVAGRGVAAARPNPTLSADVENVAGTGPYRGFDESETTVNFALPIELGGKRSARIAVAESEMARARIEAVATEADLRLRVTQAYIEAVGAQRRLSIAEDQVRITAENLRIARNRVRGGANSPIDEQRAAVLASNAEAEFERARRTAEATWMILTQYVGAAQTVALDQAWFDHVQPAAYGPATPIDVDGTLAYAQASVGVATAEANLRLARSQRIPDLTVSAGTRRLKATGDQAMVFGVSVPLPLLNSGAAAVSQATAVRRQSEAQRRLAGFDAGQAIAAARADQDRAASSVRASGPALVAAQEAARIARIGYAEGKFDQLVLLEAEQALLDVRTAAIDARASYHDAEARLARLTTPAPVLATTGN